MAEQNGQPVLLDARALGESYLARRFPTIDAACRARGLDWSKTPIPVTPAAHYWMGGVRTDIWGRTSVQGLFAVGEAACTGVHGANRLASNSLLESLVFAWRCADFLLQESEQSAAEFASAAPSVTRQTSLPASSEATTPVERIALQSLLWNAVGITRSAATLEPAAARLDHWKPAGSSVHDLETANLLDVARAIVAVARARCESRGAHFREDYSATSDKFQHSLVYSETVKVTC
jgi:L-aspartate oxidase